MCADTLSLHARLGFPGFELEVAEELPLRSTTALFGPSGCGKTTLLRIIAGFETPARGRISLGGESWYDSALGVNVAPHLRPVGIVFQDTRLFEHLDVAGNLRFALRRSPADDRDGRHREVIAALDLEPLLGRRVAALSGGERQRVALGRTLMARPRLLLLDEPLAALDVGRKSEILPYLEQLPERFDLPAIYVSHSVEEVALLAGEVLVMERGRVRVRDSAEAVLERSDLQGLTGRFEAGVLLEGRVTAHDAGLRLSRVEVAGRELVLPGATAVPVGETLRVRIRARDVAVALQPPVGTSIRNVVPVTIAEIVAEPETAFAELLLDLGAAHLRARVTRASVEELKLAEGARIHALIKSVSFDRPW